MASGRIGAGERERRRKLVAKWRRGGQSAAAFADRHDISQWALYSWAKQAGTGPNHGQAPRRSVRRSTTAGDPGFIPVSLVGDEDSDPLTEGVIEIRLRGGDVVRVLGEVSAERLRAVVTAVRQAC